MLGGAGGGIGRVADGASGMSSGFSCAARAGASDNASHRISAVLIFVAITGIPYHLLLSIIFLLTRAPLVPALYTDSDAQPRLFGASNHYGTLQALYRPHTG